MAGSARHWLALASSFSPCKTESVTRTFGGNVHLAKWVRDAGQMLVPVLLLLSTSSAAQERSAINEDAPSPATQTERSESEPATGANDPPVQQAEQKSEGASCWSTGIVVTAIVVGVAAAAVVGVAAAFGGVICLSVVAANVVEEAVCAPLCAGVCGGAAGLTGLCTMTFDDTCSSLTAPCTEIGGSFLTSSPRTEAMEVGAQLPTNASRRGRMRF